MVRAGDHEGEIGLNDGGVTRNTVKHYAIVFVKRALRSILQSKERPIIREIGHIHIHGMVILGKFGRILFVCHSVCIAGGNDVSANVHRLIEHHGTGIGGVQAEINGIGLKSQRGGITSSSRILHAISGIGGIVDGQIYREADDLILGVKLVFEIGDLSIELDAVVIASSSVT